MEKYYIFEVSYKEGKLEVVIKRTGDKDWSVTKLLDADNIMQLGEKINGDSKR